MKLKMFTLEGEGKTNVGIETIKFFIDNPSLCMFTTKDYVAYFYLLFFFLRSKDADKRQS